MNMVLFHRERVVALALLPLLASGVCEARMSSGQTLEGAGCITWWGFGPARDLLEMGEIILNEINETF